MTSIRRWLLGLLIFGLAAGYSIFSTARTEASELFNYELSTVAHSLPHNITANDTAEGRSHDLQGIEDDRLVIDIWNRSGRLIYHSPREPELPRFGDNFRSVEREGNSWRAFGVTQADRYVQVAQPFSVREDLAVTLALRIIWPLGAADSGHRDDRAVRRRAPTHARVMTLQSAQGALARVARIGDHHTDARGIASASRCIERPAHAPERSLAGATHVRRRCRT